jgi:hypothetical protein
VTLGGRLLRKQRRNRNYLERARGRPFSTCKVPDELIAYIGLMARKREVKDGKRVLFPVRLVGFEALRDWECFDAGKDSAREIRKYFIPDFSNWKDHDSYQTAFQRLVKDSKAGDRG